MGFAENREDYIRDIYREFKECFVKEAGEDGLRLIDPFEKRVIGFHYGETHFAVAFILFGYLQDDKKIYTTGKELLSNFLANISVYQKEKEYHWDFNNFALCILIEFLEKYQINDGILNAEELKKVVMKQQDSVHGTINWMPMRMMTNRKKYDWTGDSYYLAKADVYMSKIKEAAYEDGFFEDFLPKGKSFNFQYHIYTVALLSALSVRFEDVTLSPLSIQRCVDIVDPEGDINYFGRGCNQIFAWGPALYLFYTNGIQKECDHINEYFSSHFSAALKNKNLILNQENGAERSWWWDYHYSTVYFAHFAFWISLTYIDGVGSESVIKEAGDVSGDSGVVLRRKGRSFVCQFGGRQKYLAERGPVIANATIDGITLFKGPLGPCGQMFGNKYSRPISSIINYLGPIKEKLLCGKILILQNVMPAEIKSSVEEQSVSITYNLKKRENGLRFSFPAQVDLSGYTLDLMVDGEPIHLALNGRAMGPYGATYRYDTKLFSGKEISLYIKVRKE